MQRDELERYARQIILKEVGGAGQAALSHANVLLVGTGGLGGPAGLYLAAAGVGHIGLIDEDVVALSNLHRQIQFRTSDVNALKTKSMKNSILKLNPHINVREYRHKIDVDNAESIIADYDIVLDGTDDFDTRFLVNAVCLKTKIPLVSGALGRFDGQLSVFKNDGKSACYQCFVPIVPTNIETCSAVGILGALAGIIGSMMAMETIKIITGAGTPLYGKLFLYDGLSASSRTISLPKDPACPACLPCL
ncbi:MAG: molybdopterin-synthase adenylyltransferase MoeB [Robiginitomaculum sp.]